jgi:hypothetical protein
MYSVTTCCWHRRNSSGSVQPAGPVSGRRGGDGVPRSRPPGRLDRLDQADGLDRLNGLDRLDRRGHQGEGGNGGGRRRQIDDVQDSSHEELPACLGLFLAPLLDQ